jgi:outer membrane protein OmpA-like peptidoglycan-associated protein
MGHPTKNPGAVLLLSCALIGGCGDRAASVETGVSILEPPLGLDSTLVMVDERNDRALLLDLGGDSRLVLPESILFDLNEDKLKPSSERALLTLDELMLKPSPDAPVRVEGHTDDLGTDAHNMVLSRRRAESVRTWLLQHGRAEAALSIEAYGETRPRVPNTSDANRKANRRVELLIGATPSSK